MRPLLCTIAALLIRLYRLSPDLLCFADEGHYLAEARVLTGHDTAGGLFYAKPLYSAFLALALAIGNDRIVAAQIGQALVGALWVPMVFHLARRLFPTAPRVAWCAAFVTVVEPWGIFYSRHLFPDPLAGLCWMGSLILLCPRPRSRDAILFSGLCFGMAITSNYRMLLLLPFTVGLLGYLHEGRLRQRVVSIVPWLGMMMAPLIACQGLYALLAPAGTASYFRQLLIATSFHAGFGLKIDAWATYPTLLVTYDGWVLAIALLCGLIGLIRSTSPPARGVVGLTFLLPLTMMAFVYFPYARLFAPLLFWHAILAAYGSEQTVQVISHHWTIRPAPLMAGLAVLLGGSMIPNLRTMVSAHLPYQTAIRWLHHHGPSKPRIGTTSPVLFKQRAPDWTVLPLAREKESEAQSRTHLLNSDLHYAVVDGYQYTRIAQSLSTSPTPVAQWLAQACPQVLNLACPNPMAFWTQFAWEHNVSWHATRQFLTGVVQEPPPCIVIYDLMACRRQLVTTP